MKKQTKVGRFPQLPVQESPQFIERTKVIGQWTVVRELAKRVRQVLTDLEKNN